MRSSVFTTGEEVSTSFIDALRQVNENAQQLTEADSVKCLGDECHIHVKGYGLVKYHQAKSEAMHAHKLAGEASAVNAHGSAAYYHDRAAMFHRAVAQHDSSLKKGPGGHQYHSRPVHTEAVVTEAFAVGDPVATGMGTGEVVSIAGEDPVLKYVVKLHHEEQSRIFGHHELQKVTVHEAHQPMKGHDTIDGPGKDIVWGKVESKYKRAQARGFKARDKEKHHKKWFDENVDVVDAPVIAENENAIRHDLTVTSGASGPGNSLNTSHPEKHWLVGEHLKGGHETHYMRVHVQHPWNPEKSYHTVISGHGKGEGYEVGHHVKIHDDGNGRSHFPKHQYDHRFKQYVPGTGAHGVITHVAKHPDGMTAWPHSGRISLHVLK